eukprot:4728216-Prymnesium_polylepis.1
MARSRAVKPAFCARASRSALCRSLLARTAVTSCSCLAARSSKFSINSCRICAAWLRFFSTASTRADLAAEEVVPCPDARTCESKSARPRSATWAPWAPAGARASADLESASHRRGAGVRATTRRATGARR